MSAVDEVKQVIVFRGDLLSNKRVTVGKIAGQVAHAAMLWLADRFKRCGDDVVMSDHERGWLCGSMSKIIVSCADEKEMRSLGDLAIASGLESHVVIDEGRTVFDNVPTATCLVIGPALSSKIDAITKHLNLLR